MPAPVADFRLPRVQTVRLANGIEVRTVEHRDMPVLAVMVIVTAGSASDPASRPGLAALTADLLDEGAGARSAMEFHDALARIGARLETSTICDATVVSLVALRRFADRALDLVADLVCRPRFDVADFDRVRALRVSRLRQLRDSPSAVAERTMAATLFGATPYGHLAIGREAALLALDGDDVQRFHARHYGPSHVTLIAVGDAGHAELAAGAERAFGAWTSVEASGRATPETGTDDADAAAAAEPGAIVLVDRPGAPQSELRIARVAAPRATPDYHALLVLNTVLGGQFVSRINLNLRENKGYTYGARSAFDFRLAPGPFVVHASVQTDATAASVKEVLFELEAIRGATPPTARELQTARAALTRGYARNFETAEQVAHAVADAALYSLPADYYEQFVRRVEQVTAEQVVDAAARWLDPAAMSTIVVGDRARVEAPLEALGRGPVRVVEPA